MELFCADVVHNVSQGRDKVSTGFWSNFSANPIHIACRPEFKTPVNFTMQDALFRSGLEDHREQSGIHCVSLFGIRILFYFSAFI